MVLKKKKKLTMAQKLQIVQKTIKEKGDDYRIPLRPYYYKDAHNLRYEKQNTNSWFDSYIHYSSMMYQRPNPFFDVGCSKKTKFDDISSDGMMTMQIKLFLTDNQKIIIEKWFDMFTLMYNETIRLIKSKMFDKKEIPSITRLKKELIAQKNKIKNKSKITIIVNGKSKNISVDMHLLDYAINDALNRYNSCMTSLEKGHIKQFRLRYLKLTKPNKIIKIERLAFKKNTFYTTSLGKIVTCSTPNFNYYENVKSIATLTRRGNEYFLLLKHKKKLQKGTSANNSIGIDLGTNPFVTGYSDLEVIQIGRNITKNMKNRLKIIDKINGHETFTKNKINKVIQKKYGKIKNMINDMHWKVANDLTAIYRNIFVGNWSTKKTGQTEINPMIKRIANQLAIFQFKQKLKYKCEQKKCNYKEIDESYTTMACGRCGNLDRKIGGKKIYNCKRCKLVVNRDVNSARIITMLGMN